MTVIAAGLALAVVAGFVWVLWAYHHESVHPAGETDGFEWHLVMACPVGAPPAERLVVATVDGMPDAHVWCVEELVHGQVSPVLAPLASRQPRLHLIAPAASADGGSQGRAALLDHAWSEISRRTRSHGQDSERVIVGVIDAHGTVDPDCLRALAGPQYFGDPGVGAVQVAVRIADRTSGGNPPAGWWRRLVVDVQDVELIGPVAAMQIARRRTHRVVMGGNGQFTRLSTLDDIATWAGTPWPGALVEDFELGLHVLLSGRDTAYCHHAWVSQRGLPRVRDLLRQRSRSVQGSIRQHRYLGPVWAGARADRTGTFDVSSLILLPWLHLVATAVLVLLTGLSLWQMRTVVSSPAAVADPAQWALPLLVLCMAFGPVFVWGPVYRRQVEPGISRRRAGALGLALSATNTLNLVASAWAFARVVAPHSAHVDPDPIESPPPPPPVVRVMEARYSPRRARPGPPPPAEGYGPRRALQVDLGAEPVPGHVDARYDAWAVELAAPRRSRRAGRKARSQRRGHEEVHR